MNRSRKLLQVFFLIILLVGLACTPTRPSALGVATGGEQGAGAARIQPALAQLAASAPGQTVRVIVQMAGGVSDGAQLVQALGGEVVQDLHIIRAFAAELTAAQAAQLAAQDGVRWVSLDAPVEHSGKKPPKTPTPAPGQQWLNYYRGTLGIEALEAEQPNAPRGKGITVAVIDSGILPDNDFTNASYGPRLTRGQTFAHKSRDWKDTYGHGTHVAGIIGGNGKDSDGLYMGIAPETNLISLKISDSNGMAYESDTVAALQWVLDNKDRYNIRVVNLSINSTIEQSYHTSPLDAAVEILWFNSIVVVASAGNVSDNGGANTIRMAPANDPFIITVGASNENGTPDRADDFVAPFSAYGTTLDGFAKPELIAPGYNIISVLSRHSDWDNEHPERALLKGEYFRISGTSMAAPMVTGAVALLLEREPHLTPDQVKYRLMATASSIQSPQDDRYLDIYAALTTETSESANTGLEVSQMLLTGSNPVIGGSVNWNSVNWNSVNWNSVNWNSVNWNSVNWNSVNWNSVSWEN